MGSLHPKDNDLHYCDNSHRWIAPEGWDDDAWRTRVRTHMERHRATMGGPAEQDEYRECGPLPIVGTTPPPRKRKSTRSAPRRGNATVAR